MCRENSKHRHQGHHHHHGETDPVHHHDEHHAEGSSLSRSERLIIRLQHTIRHNHDHAATYRSMAEEAQELGAEEAARWIRGAAEQSARQTEELENALAALKNQ
jgi:hypothetical protein